ncbi:MAG TPA: hypothetical protein VFB08_22175 [Burkholderiales bacterium]|nr:hypothetical protein [Burkholderiales bacterium]
MIFFRATIQKDQLSADFEWPGKVNLTRAELDDFIAKLRRVRRELLQTPEPHVMERALLNLRQRP